MSRPRALAALMAPITRQALGRSRSAVGSLLAEWTAIVGDDLARRTIPDRLSFRRGQRDGGELVLRVEPADALEVQHEMPRLIDRINRHYGYAAIARVKLIQTPRPQPAPRPAAGTLDPADRAALEAVLARVEDAELRERLARLGRALFATDRRGGPE